MVDKIELAPEHIEVKSGEVMESSGSVQPAVWIEAQGRRMRTDNEQVQVFVFMSADQAWAHALAVMKECVTLEIAAELMGPPT